MTLRFLALIFLSTSVGFCQSDLRGLEFEDDTYNSLPLKPSYFNPKVEAHPSFYSLKKYVPRVATQHTSNTGVAWASVWYGRTMLEAIANGWRETLMITQNAYSPVYNYKKIVSGDGCSDKIKLTSILESMQEDGSVTFNDFREFCYDTVPSFLIAKAALMPGYVRLFNTTDKGARKVDVIKAALTSNNPVILGMICPPSFKLATEFWQPREEPLRDYGGHAVCVVGYDDTKFGGAFEVVNSWGKSWGNEGFTWFRYEDVENYILYGYELLNTQSMLKPSKLSADVVFNLNTGERMNAVKRNAGYYKLNKTYGTGAQFKVGINVNQNVFFYAIAFDQGWNHSELYPNEKNGVYPWIEDDRREIKLPVEGGYIELTPPAGKNYLCLVFSGQYIDIDDIKYKMKESKENFIERYYAGPMKDPAFLKWREDAIEVEGDFNRSSLWIIVIELDQT